MAKMTVKKGKEIRERYRMPGDLGPQKPKAGETEPEPKPISGADQLTPSLDVLAEQLMREQAGEARALTMPPPQAPDFSNDPVLQTFGNGNGQVIDIGERPPSLRNPEVEGGGEYTPSYDRQMEEPQNLGPAAGGGFREKAHKGLSIARAIAETLFAGMAAGENERSFASGFTAAGNARAVAPYQQRQLEAQTAGAEADAKLGGFQAETADVRLQFLPEQLRNDQAASAITLEVMELSKQRERALINQIQSQMGLAERGPSELLKRDALRFVTEMAVKEAEERFRQFMTPEEAAYKAALTSQALMGARAQEAHASLYDRTDPNLRSQSTTGLRVPFPSDIRADMAKELADYEKAYLDSLGIRKGMGIPASERANPQSQYNLGKQQIQNKYTSYLQRAEQEYKIGGAPATGGEGDRLGIR